MKVKEGLGMWYAGRTKAKDFDQMHLECLCGFIYRWGNRSDRSREDGTGKERPCFKTAFA